MRFLVTAGPTREYIDAVRFISNPSTGRMGLAVVRRTLQAGHDVTLILGPTWLKPPPEAHTLRVTSAREMLDAVSAEYEKCDALVMTAAVCDYEPGAPGNRKIKKGDRPLVLELVRTPDILLEVAPRKGSRINVGFALEVQDSIKHARQKLLSKKLDFIVVNSPAAFGSEAVDGTIITASGEMEELKGITKDDLAARIVGRVEQLHASHGRGT